jgi:outer membrane protein OmpA-like peptidoglycan-associated protein
MSTIPLAGGVPSPAHAPRRLRALLLAFATLLTVLLGAAAPASASHLQGGFFTAKVTDTGRLQGTLTYLEVYACPSGIGSQKALDITVTSPNNESVQVTVDTEATRCLSGGSTYEGSFDIPLNTSTFSGGAPDGAYTLEWTSGNRIYNIVNLASSGSKSLRFRAQVRKVTGVSTSAPFLGSDIATGIGIGDLYSQNLNASDPDDVLGNGTLTYEALTGDPDLAPDTNIIDVAKLQANGQVEIPVGTTTGMANNSYYVYKVRVTDDQGDFAERDVLLRAVTPNHPPVINGLNTTTGYDINAGDTQTITFDATDPDGANIVNISGAGLPSWAQLTQTPGNPAQATLTLSPPAGANTRSYRLNFDAVDNDSTQVLTGSRTIEVRVNGTPETQLLTWPAASTASTSATFTFAAANPAYTFECSIDGGTTWDPCTSPASYTGLADGSRTFKVRANDGTNVDPTPASYTWTILDTTAPDTSLTSTPALLATSSTAAFQFSSNEGGATFQCSIDGGSYAACSSPKSYTGLADGSHTLQVRAVDGASNVDPTPSSYTWVIDTTAPDTSLAGQPAALSTSAAANFTFSSGDGTASFECKLDGGSWAPCTSPGALSGLADGSHTYEVRAVDPAGNVDPTPASSTWVVDTAAPATNVTAHPASLVRTNAATVAFASADTGATFECKLDGGSWTPCTSPRALTGLADGSHTLRIRATDQAGNVEATPAVVTWTVDTTAPPAPGLKQTPSETASSSNFVFDRDPGTTLECQLDGGTWVACDSTYAPEGLADGPHTLKVRQTDAAGNVSAESTHSWILDRVAPEAPTVLSGPAAQTNDKTATFEFTAEAGATIECRVDGGAWGPCSSPLVLSGLALGEHVLELRATDAAGNASPVRTERWTVTKAADPAPTGPKEAKVEIARNVAVDPKKSTVGCSLTGVNITDCKVAIYAKASELGLAEPGSKKDVLIRIGTGYAETDGSTGRVGVKVVLNAKGKAAMARPGGVKVRVNIKARTTTGGDPLYAHKYSKMRPATQVVVPSDGLFATDSSEISVAGKRYLQSIGGGLYGAKGLTCTGHTDAQGAATYNARLGLARAKAVCGYLGRLGVKAGKSVRSAGEAHPRSTNMTASGRALNRRVELTVKFEG